MILTNNLEVYIIELPKCERYISKNKDLNAWVNFIRKPEDLNMKNIDNEAVKKAKKVLDEISADEREQELEFQRLMYEMDNKAIEAAGYDRGLEDGIQRGIQQGVIEIAKNMLSQNTDIEFIIRCTGLTKEEIENLR